MKIADNTIQYNTIYSRLKENKSEGNNSSPFNSTSNVLHDSPSFGQIKFNEYAQNVIANWLPQRHFNRFTKLVAGHENNSIIVKISTWDPRYAASLNHRGLEAEVYFNKNAKKPNFVLKHFCDKIFFGSPYWFIKKICKMTENLKIKMSSEEIDNILKTDDVDKQINKALEDSAKKLTKTLTN